jgi:arginine deiminase
MGIRLEDIVLSLLTPFMEDFSVTSEVGTLKRLLIHSPDSSLGKVVPSKAQDWLFEDIVHLDTVRRKEYDFYIKILLFFLDPEKVKGKTHQIDAESAKREFYKPGKPGYFNSDKVIELQTLLTDILHDSSIKSTLVASTCAIEGCTFETQHDLLTLSPIDLTKVFISGMMPDDQMIFAPIPNFIFTRDIGVVINDFVLLNKPAKKARTREALLVKYIFYNHPFFKGLKNNIIELKETNHHFLLPKDGDEKKVTLEGGDVMTVSKDHLLVGVSERTSMEAAHQVVTTLFAKNVVSKITIVKIPKKRDYMHIDTVFTQVKRDTWVMLGNFSRKAIKHEGEDAVQRILEPAKKEDELKIIQFSKTSLERPVYFESLEDLLVNISQVDLGVKGRVKIIFSGNNIFPYDAREQWTDSCNLLALKEGVVLGYDRNDKTLDAFKENGFTIIHAHDFIDQVENNVIDVKTIQDTIITMPSAELSRARGGFHCMSMPILRDELN